MNVKRRVDKRYRPLDEAHVSKWERLDQYKIGRKPLLPGQVVKITGQRGAEFTFMYGERNYETGSVNLTFVGGKPGYRQTRTFTPDKVAKFLYMSVLGQHREDADDGES